MNANGQLVDSARQVASEFVDFDLRSASSHQKFDKALKHVIHTV
jgi:hypothetical protein